MITGYFERVKKRIAGLGWLIEREVVETEYDEDADAGLLGGTITFKDGSTLYFKEVLISHAREYRFHYMDKRNNLILRWGSAPHHKKIKTFPFHVHTSNGVSPSKPLNLIEVLDQIEGMIIEQIEK
jgi:hypothetical protein